MRAVAAAYKKRSLDDFTAALSKYSAQLKADPVIFSHLDALYDGLLEQVAAQTSIPHLARHPNINPSPRPPATLTPVPESHSASRAILQCSGQSRGGHCGLISNSVPAPFEVAAHKSCSARLEQLKENSVDLKLGQHTLQFQSSSASWVNSNGQASSIQVKSLSALQKDLLIMQLQQDCEDLQQMKCELQNSVSELEEKFLALQHP